MHFFTALSRQETSRAKCSHPHLHELPDAVRPVVAQEAAERAHAARRQPVPGAVGAREEHPGGLALHHGCFTLYDQEDSLNGPRLAVDKRHTELSIYFYKNWE